MRNPRDAAKLRGQQQRRQPPMSARQKAMTEAARRRTRAAMASGDQFYGAPRGAVTARQQPARATQARQYPTFGIDPTRARGVPARASTRTGGAPQFSNEQNRQLMDRAMRAAAANRSVGTNPAAAAPGGAPNQRNMARGPGVPDQQPRAVPLPNTPISRTINKGGYMKKATKMNTGGMANCGASMKPSGPSRKK